MRRLEIGEAGELECLDVAAPAFEERDYYLIEGLFSSREVDLVLDHVAEKEFGPGRVGDGEVREQARDSRVAWIAANHWAAFRVAAAVKTVAWLAERTQLFYWRCMQVAYYAPGMFFKEHRDAGSGKNGHRLWSGVCEIQNAHGGYLMVRGEQVHMNPGDCVVFRSRQLHEVVPPVEGVRATLTLWLSANRRTVEL